MILRDALDIRRGTAQRNKVYKGTYKVWDRNKIALEGYCKQNTTTGKNWLPANNGNETINGITFTKNADGTITANGTATDGINYYINRYTYVDIPAGTYTFSDGVISGEDGATYFTYLDGGPSYNSSINNPTFTITETIQVRARIVIRSGQTLNNVVFKPMLERGSVVTDFEPYTGGQPSPNPDYPQEIEVMQGRQVVNIKSKNELNYDLEPENKYYDLNGQPVTIPEAVYVNQIINLLANTTYTFSYEEKIGDATVRLCEYKEDGTFIKRTLIQNNNVSVTLDNKTSYVITSTNKAPNSMFIKPQIQEGSTATPWVPYKNEQYTVDLKSKNLFDVNDIYDKNSLYRKDEDDYITIEFDNSKGTTTKYFNYYTNKSSNLKLDTKYYIATEIKEVSGTGTINIASTYQTQSQIKNIISYDLSDLKNNDIKVDETTTVSDFTERITMIRTYVKAEAGQKGSITFRLSVLEEQPTVESFNYEPYYDYKLAGIGNYKDNFYTDKGKWYLEKKFENKTIDNNTTIYRTKTDTNTIHYNISNSQGGLSLDVINCISNKLKNYTANQLWSNDNEGIAQSRTQIVLRISKERATSVAELTEWLQSNNINGWFILGTPTVEEITAPTLINQLNALYQAI